MRRRPRESPWGRPGLWLPPAFVGALAGVMATAAAFHVGMMIDSGPARWMRQAPEMAFPVFLLTALFAGPGALVLGLLLAPSVCRLRDRCPSRSLLVAWGVLLGLPLGPVNLGLVAAVLDVELFPELIWMSFAGGAGLGFGTALAVSYLDPAYRR